MRGRRVKLIANVIETRDSGHIGDAFLQLKPERPADHSKIELGVGILDYGLYPEDNTCTEIYLKPNDGREEFWIDPKIMYSLHDQTVELYAELTSEPFHVAPKYDSEDGVMTVEPNTIQIKGGTEKDLQRKFNKIGDGLYMHSSGDYELKKC